MGKIYFPFFSLILYVFHISSTTLAQWSPAVGATNFIRTSCGQTEYPVLCFQSLSIYRNQIQQSPKQLALIALLVSLATARTNAGYVARLARDNGVKDKDLSAIKSCADNMYDSVDRLSNAIKELGQMGRVGRGQNLLWQMTNVQNWVTAALTDENTCVVGFLDHGSADNIKTAIKGRVIRVAEVTCVALALVNLFAERPY